MVIMVVFMFKNYLMLLFVVFAVIGGVYYYDACQYNHAYNYYGTNSMNSYGGLLSTGVSRVGYVWHGYTLLKYDYHHPYSYPWYRYWR